MVAATQSLRQGDAKGPGSAGAPRGEKPCWPQRSRAEPCAGPECRLRCFATLGAGQEGAGSFLCPIVFSQVFVFMPPVVTWAHVMWHTRTPEIKPGFSARRASGRLEQGLSVRVKSSCAYLAVYSGSTLLEVEKLPKIIDWGKDQR